MARENDIYLIPTPEQLMVEGVAQGFNGGLAFEFMTFRSVC